MPNDRWSVTVWRNGEVVVGLENNSLSGREIRPEDEAAIRQAALHLLAFIGEPCELLSRLIPEQVHLGSDFTDVLAAGIADGSLYVKS